MRYTVTQNVVITDKISDSSVTVSQRIFSAVQDLAVALNTQRDSRILAIKLVRDLTGVGLSDAKVLVEAAAETALGINMEP